MSGFIFINYIFIFGYIIFIFWALFFLHSFWNEKKINAQQKLIFECGFKSFNAVNIEVPMSFFTSAALVLLYELEFIYFIPIFFNLTFLTWLSLSVIMFFFLYIFVCVVIDAKFNLIKWEF